MRITKHRQEIIDLLEHSEDAMSAADIFAALPHINLATIYRNLESFALAGTVTKLNLGGDEARFEVQHEPHHHAICDDCQKVIHFTVNDEELIKEFALPGFNIKNLEVTLRGVCTDKHQNLQKD